jgi:hypothetical protein
LFISDNFIHNERKNFTLFTSVQAFNNINITKAHHKIIANNAVIHKSQSIFHIDIFCFCFASHILSDIKAEKNTFSHNLLGVVFENKLYFIFILVFSRFHLFLTL